MFKLAPISLASSLASSLLLAAWPLSAQEAQIRLLPAADGLPAQVEIVGEWRSGCPPLISEVIAGERELTVIAAPSSSRCAGEPGPFQLIADLPLDSKSDAANGVWRLRYELQDDPLTPPRLMAFALAAQGGHSVADPESGFWWGEAGGEFDHAGPGIGAQLERQRDVLALTFSGYSDGGTPEWTFGAATLDGPTSDISLNRLQGGRGPFGGYAGPQEATAAGRVQIEWLGAARAVFWFSRASADGRGIELQPISMVRFDFGQQPGAGWIGRWLFEEPTAKSALVIEFTAIETLADRFTLLAASGETLSCQLDARRPQSPPSGCELQFADDRRWQFADVGLAGMRGVNAQGTNVRAAMLTR